MAPKKKAAAKKKAAPKKKAAAKKKAAPKKKAAAKKKTVRLKKGHSIAIITGVVLGDFMEPGTIYSGDGETIPCAPDESQ